MTGRDLVDIIKSGDVNANHKKLEEVLAKMDRQTLEILTIRLTYAIDAMTNMKD